MDKIKLTFTVNRQIKEVITEPNRTLLKLLREDLDLISVKEGCDQGDCGACIVIMDGLAVNSCMVLAPQAQGSEIITLEGMANNGELHPLQKMFIEKWAFQCGFCTPGMIMSAYALLLHTPNPSRDEIKEAISGNLCRCTGYQSVIDAIRAAVEE
jgi:aerobic-type carbon monoxide dehydrogenase small subunit (CoxS/CutS family)